MLKTKQIKELKEKIIMESGLGLGYMNEMLDKLLSSQRELVKSICKRIYVEEVDWAEWGISDEEAGEDFEESFKKYMEDSLSTKGGEK